MTKGIKKQPQQQFNSPGSLTELAAEAWIKQKNKKVEDRTPIASETHRHILENINIEMEALGDYSLIAMLSYTIFF